jgi:hypothetical protein
MVLLILLALLVLPTLAQDTPQEVPAEVPQQLPAQPPPALSITRVEPASVPQANAPRVTIFGANFTPATTVRLVGAGLVTTTFVNSGALLIDLPAGLPAGVYPVELSDPVNGTATAPAPLTLLAPTPTPTPPPTPVPTDTPVPPPTAAPPPTEIPALPPPTIVPGRPVLTTRNFSTSAASIAAGETLRLNFEVVNLGSRAAQGVSVALATGSKFLPAGGQGGAVLPDIAPGGVAAVSLPVQAALDAPAGPNSVPVTLAYRDFAGEVYTATINLTVTVAAQTRSIQPAILRYRTLPLSAAPGGTLTLALQITNTGTETASGVIVRSGKDGVLLPGFGGDSVSVGDLAPGATTVVEMALVVRQDAKAGIQPQPMTLSYLDNGETKTVDSLISVQIDAPVTERPLLLLSDYSTGSDDALNPGQRFTLDFTLENVGGAAAQEVLVTFGTVETAAPPGGDGGSGTGSGSGGSGSTSNPGSLFAPMGSGGTLFAGTLAAGAALALTQDFMVNGTVRSGVYLLPVTLRYQDAQNNPVQTTVNASLAVVTVPRLQFSPAAPLPPTVNVGEPLPLALNVQNIGGATVRLTGYTITADAADVLDGATGVPGNLAPDDALDLTATVLAQAEGPFTVTLTLSYLDDLNQVRQLTQSYESAALALPPPEALPPVETPPPAETPAAPPPFDAGRLLLALLGLGS